MEKLPTAPQIFSHDKVKEYYSGKCVQENAFSLKHVTEEDIG